MEMLRQHHALDSIGCALGWPSVVVLWQCLYLLFCLGFIQLRSVDYDAASLLARRASLHEDLCSEEHLRQRGLCGSVSSAQLLRFDRSGT